MVRRLTWSVEARTSRKNIFDYWNNRNKSKIYSNKLDSLFKENLKTLVKRPEFGIPTTHENIKIIIVSHFEIIYKFSQVDLTVLDIWDTRQNPENLPDQ